MVSITVYRASVHVREWLKLPPEEFFVLLFFFDNQLWGELLCKREPNNVRDSCTVTVIQDDHLVEVLQQYARIAVLEASHVKKRRAHCH